MALAFDDRERSVRLKTTSLICEALDLRHLITFSAGEVEYGLEPMRVREVINVREISWLPKAPSYVKGIITLRGDAVPVVDPRNKSGSVAREGAAHTRVVVVEVEGRLMGIVADPASQVVRIPEDPVAPPPAAARGTSQELLIGVGRLNDWLAIFLNADAILTTDERATISSMDRVS
jgi:purine-binding chemotaxis protein CheW